jgi:hypothetical protein
MKRRTKILILVSVLTFLIGWAVEPSIVRWQVTKRLPQGVHAGGPISLGWGGVTLHDVSIDRDWVTGILKEVWVARSGAVEVRGGDLWIDLDKRPTGSGEGEKRSILATGLTVAVQKGNYSANLTKASWDGNKACFSEGTVLSDRGVLHVYIGCYVKADESITADQVATHITDLPKIPGLTLTETDVTAFAVSAWRDKDLFVVNVKNFTAGPINGQGAHLSGSTEVGIIFFDAVTLTITHPWLSNGPTRFDDIHLSLKDRVGRLLWNSNVLIEADPAAQTVHGDASCQEWMNVLPESWLVGPLKTLKWTGDLGFNVQMKPKPTFAVVAKCRAICTDFPNLRTAFQYDAYRADGTTFGRPTGPGTADWVPIADAGPMSMAVINMEDYSFPFHHGYLSDAFQNSFVSDVQTGKFARGGSTITQQTAKNLWLKREKTIGRKISELFLAQALESCLTKDQIIETYLNIVEFAPNVYGIGPGARHWFDKKPEALTPTEAFWLASILPAPKRAHQPTGADMKRIDQLMAILATKGRIPDVGGADDDIDTTGWNVNP